MPKGNVFTVTYKKRKKHRKDPCGTSSSTIKPRVKKYSEKCHFCTSSKDKEEELGKLIKKNGFTVHYFCLLFASGLCQRGKTDREGIYGFLTKDIDKEVTRGSRLRCEYCKDVGATIGCVVKSCRKKFHLSCGKDNGSLHQFYDTFKSFCPEHRPIQTDTSSGKSKKSLICPICMSNVTAVCNIGTLKSNCCKNAWFHRNCVQRYSLSAGLHFFKCPMCNDKNNFQNEMLEFGVYIPDQDASWETEPNAYNELLERHKRCDASICNCSMGREHENANGTWELILCDYCGSQGSHVGCDGLYSIKKGNQICQECWDIEKRVGLEKKNSKNCKSKSKGRKSVSLTDAQRKRREAELQRRCRSDKTLMRITPSETDTEIDVEGRSEDENKTTLYHNSPIEQPHKRQRLSLNRSKRSSNNNNQDLMSANITLTDDSCEHSVTATVSSTSSNSSIIVNSSNTSTAYFPDFMEEMDDDSEIDISEESSSDSSDSYSIQDITDLPERKSLTITWRGKKIHISKPSSPNHERLKTEEDWTLHLQMSDSDDSIDQGSNNFHTRRNLHRSCNKLAEDSYSDKCDSSPPVLVPVDEDISIKCYSPRYKENQLPPVLSPNLGYKEATKRQSPSTISPDKYGSRLTRRNISRNPHVRRSIQGEILENTLIPSISSIKQNNTGASSSNISIITISSSDSDSGDFQQPKRNKYLSRKTIAHQKVNNYDPVDQKEMEELASSIKLLPKYINQARVVMEPEVVILD